MFAYVVCLLQYSMGDYAFEIDLLLGSDSQDLVPEYPQQNLWQEEYYADEYVPVPVVSECECVLLLCECFLLAWIIYLCCLLFDLLFVVCSCDTTALPLPTPTLADTKPTLTDMPKGETWVFINTQTVCCGYLLALPGRKITFPNPAIVTRGFHCRSQAHIFLKG